MLAWLVLVLATLLGLFLVLGNAPTGFDSVPGAPVAAGVVLLLLVLYSVVARPQPGERSGWVQRGLYTVMAVLVAVLAYNFPGKFNLPPMLDAVAVPQSDRADAGSSAFHSVRIRRNEQGRFLARGEVNGQQIGLIVDTGASAVILRHADAELAGLDLNALAYSVPVETANGPANAAAVRLRSLAVGDIRIDGLEALVAEPGSLNESLLGMTFLTRLRSYELSGEFITLRN